MAEVSAAKGFGALAVGGIASVAVVLGGVVLVRTGLISAQIPLLSGSSTAPAVVQDTAQDPGQDPAASGENTTNSNASSPQAASSSGGGGTTAESGAQAEPETRAAPGTNAAVIPEAAPGDAAPAESSAAENGAPADGKTGPAGDAASAPELETVRVDPETGIAVISGRAQPGATVFILVDEEKLAEVQAGANGTFAWVGNITLKGKPRVVSLLAGAGSAQAASESVFIIAPKEEADRQIAQTETAAEDADNNPPVRSAADEPEETALGAPSGSAAADGRADAGGSAETGPDTVLADGTGGPAETAQTETAVTEGAALASQPGVAVLQADAEGIELIQPAPPADPGLAGKVALDAISYTAAGALQLAGRAQPGTLVRVYVGNRPVAGFEADAGGAWSGSLDGIDPGVYTLRLDETDATTGQVLSRLETPIKREAPEALAAPDVPGAPGGPVPAVRAVTVQKGDTLWAISRDRYGSGVLYVRLFEANQGAIRDPNLIYPGQVFSIPD